MLKRLRRLKNAPLWARLAAVLIAFQAAVLCILVLYGELRGREMVAREQRTPDAINAELAQSLLREMSIVWMIGGLITAGAAVWFVIRLGASIQEIRRSAVRFASGDLRHRIEPMGSAELRDLSRSLNRMAEQLSGQINLLREQRNEQETILQSMQVGVIALNQDQRVLSINRVAQLMLGLPDDECRGQRLESVVTEGGLLRFAADALGEPTDLSREFELRTTAPLHVRAIAGRLRDAHGEPLGVVIILSDITHIRRLERLRTDFAANASHELRTPITNIKGYVETLLEDGALHSPQASQFLGIIGRNAERLGAIIDDMLALTSLERSDIQDRLVTQPTPVGAMLNAVRSHLEPDARSHGARVVIKVEQPLFAEVNARLAEQAVANLISNAIKYGPAGTTVTVSARPIAMKGDAPGVEIVVSDDGPGIAPDHVPRLFERFYRVDKARSRQQGGTGLGLAIVKHIALVHGGSIRAESDLGVGSTFYLVLPRVVDPEPEEIAEPAPLDTAGPVSLGLAAFRKRLTGSTPPPASPTDAVSPTGARPSDASS
jgi:two-component system phosphate regulon sensor histidine kinase PhoR